MIPLSPGRDISAVFPCPPPLRSFLNYVDSHTLDEAGVLFLTVSLFLVGSMAYTGHHAGTFHGRFLDPCVQCWTTTSSIITCRPCCRHATRYKVNLQVLWNAKQDYLRSSAIDHAPSCKVTTPSASVASVLCTQYGVVTLMRAHALDLELPHIGFEVQCLGFSTP